MFKFCTFNKKEYKWKYPRQGNQKKIGQIIPVNPIETEKYYLKYLLPNVYGKSFQDLKTINNIENNTFEKLA